MTEQSSLAHEQWSSEQEAVAAAANPASREECGALLLDRVGRIVSCGEPAERIFGASPARLLGRPISDFIAGLFLGGTSPSYSARYLVYLCASDEWRAFDAKDVAGRPFKLALNLSQTVTEGREVYLLNVRRPQQLGGH